MSELVHYGVGDQVATLTLDSPHNRNALSGQLLAELAEAGSQSMTGATTAVMALLSAIVTAAKPVIARITGHVRAGGMGIVGACLLGEIRETSPQGAAETKRLLTRGRRQRLAEESAAMAELSARLFASAEAQEGIHAFLEKRPPAWRVS